MRRARIRGLIAEALLLSQSAWDPTGSAYFAVSALASMKLRDWISILIASIAYFLGYYKVALGFTFTEIVTWGRYSIIALVIALASAYEIISISPLTLLYPIQVKANVNPWVLTALIVLALWDLPPLAILGAAVPWIVTLIVSRCTIVSVSLPLLVAVSAGILLNIARMKYR